MVRLVQAAAFFAVVAAGYLLGAPYTRGSERFGVLLAGAILAATLIYVVPWVYHQAGARERPARTGEPEE